MAAAALALPKAGLIHACMYTAQGGGHSCKLLPICCGAAGCKMATCLLACLQACVEACAALDASEPAAAQAALQTVRALLQTARNAAIALNEQVGCERSGVLCCAVWASHALPCLYVRGGWP